jgi:hypothetical protein
MTPASSTHSGDTLQIEAEAPLIRQRTDHVRRRRRVLSDSRPIQPSPERCRLHQLPLRVIDDDLICGVFRTASFERDATMLYASMTSSSGQTRVLRDTRTICAEPIDLDGIDDKLRYRFPQTEHKTLSSPRMGQTMILHNATASTIARSRDVYAVRIGSHIRHTSTRRSRRLPRSLHRPDHRHHRVISRS